MKTKYEAIASVYASKFQLLMDLITDRFTVDELNDRLAEVRTSVAVLEDYMNNFMRDPTRIKFEKAKRKTVTKHAAVIFSFISGTIHDLCSPDKQGITNLDIVMAAIDYAREHFSGFEQATLFDSIYEHTNVDAAVAQKVEQLLTKAIASGRLSLYQEAYKISCYLSKTATHYPTLFRVILKADLVFLTNFRLSIYSHEGARVLKTVVLELSDPKGDLAREIREAAIAACKSFIEENGQSENFVVLIIAGDRSGNEYIKAEYLIDLTMMLPQFSLN